MCAGSDHIPTDEQWGLFLSRIVAHYYEQRYENRSSGRPRRDDRLVLEAILWLTRTRSTWRDLPARFPPWSTCYGRYRLWEEDGLMDEILYQMVRHYEWQVHAFPGGADEPWAVEMAALISVPEVRARLSKRRG